MKHFHSIKGDSDIILWIEKLNEFLSFAFNNYISFIMMMIVFSIIVEIIKMGYQYMIFQKKNSPLNPQSFASFSTLKLEEIFSWNAKRGQINLCKQIICYTMLFWCCQLTSFIDRSFSENTFFGRESPVLLDSQYPSRILDQLSNEETLEELILSPNLNPGEILGSFSLSSYEAGAYRVALTKNGQILFALGWNRLSIFDISDPKRERLISQFDPKCQVYWGMGYMFLSQDEQLLFVRESLSLSIIDVSNLSSPVLNFYEQVETGFAGSMMAVSSDRSILYRIEHPGLLMVYDISQPISPSLVFEKNIGARGGIALSQDNTKLIISANVNYMPTLQIYNATDPRNPTLISILRDPVFEKMYFASFLAFSNNGEKIFVSSRDQGSGQFLLTIFDIKEINSSLLVSSTELGPSIENYPSSVPLWFHPNQEFAFHYTKNEFKIIRIRDLEQTVLFTFSKPFQVGHECHFAISTDNSRGVATFNGKIVIMKFNIDVEANSFSQFKPNGLKIIDEVDYTRKPIIALSGDEKILFLVKEIQQETSLLSYERVRNTFLKKQSSFSFPNKSINSDDSRIIAGKKNVILFNSVSFKLFLNATGKNASFAFAQDESRSGNVNANNVAVTEDDNIIFLKYDMNWRNLILNFLTFNDRKTNSDNLTLETPINSQVGIKAPAMKISRDGNIVFCVQRYLAIYNITNLEFPLRESFKHLTWIWEILGLKLSQDERILYIFGLTSNYYHKKQLLIFNVSDIKAPQELGSIWIDEASEMTDVFELSPDENILFIGFTNGMLMINIRKPNMPTLFGYSYFLNEKYGLQFINGDNLFYTASVSGVTAFDINSQYILHMKHSQLKIGGSYSMYLNVLKMNTNLKFDYMMKKHKFFKASLFEVSSSSEVSSQRALPLWMNFDRERSLLAIEPRSPSSTGTYTISVTLSTQVQLSEFLRITSISTQEIKGLMLDILRCGHIDSQGYVSETFDPSQELLLDPKYENIEKDVRAILSQNYIQAMGEFSVAPSLSLSFEDKPLQVSSLSKGTISVSIQLKKVGNGGAYFLTKAYSDVKSTLLNGRSLLLLEGLLEKINEALKEIIIDFNGIRNCDGTITVEDGINKPISHSLSVMEYYFTQNTEPIGISEDNHLIISLPEENDHLKVSIQFNQSQSDEYQARFANKPFSFSRVTINGDKSLIYLEGSVGDINIALREIVVDLGKLKYSGGSITIIDGINPPRSRYVENLSEYFHINEAPRYDDTLQGQINGQFFYTGLYSMIELKKNTFIDKNNLSLSYDLEMQASGQHLPSWINFRSFTLSLMGTPPEKYSPLTYDFQLVVKNEFKSTTIPFTLRVNISFSYGAKLVSTYVGYLVSFIGFIFTLNKIYNFIARKYYRYPRSYKLKLGEEITDSKIFPLSFIKDEIKESKSIFGELEKCPEMKSGLLEYFINPETQSLDKEKIISTLQSLKNNYYDSADDFSRGIIEQLIVNRIVMKQLLRKEEVKTRDLFNKIKNQWMDLVSIPSSSSQFAINSENFETELAKLTSSDQKGDEETDLSTRPLLGTEILYNKNLLGDAIIAHAFSFQNLDIDTIRIDVVSHKKLKGKSLYLMIRRFLQKDIKPFVFLNKREIGYGIEYIVKENTLHFIGKLTYDLKDDTIVIHLKNNRGRILREIWLTGENKETSSVRKQSEIEDVSVAL